MTCPSCGFRFTPEGNTTATKARPIRSPELASQWITPAHMIGAAQGACGPVFLSTVLTNLIAIDTRHGYHRDTLHGRLQPPPPAHLTPYRLPPASISDSHYNLPTTLAQHPQRPQRDRGANRENLSSESSSSSRVNTILRWIASFKNRR